ncbi:hypothetical protein [Rhizobium fabae]|uniref:Uncharacterized protein n=1 Tax=Rhizobium fabae TaxID=573179 RepID=A0A7W6FHH1_9HYPH|nr:hypothetical protein [Rhizobium fabae]MBB3913895.1 hypothetical protein [Rhizobium fabae]RUM16291.1 hypothetical protein EFB14_02930 [Rhizobium fabae]
MVLIFIVLAVVGFFFTPAWLGLVGYAIYVFASRESRRNRAVESRVKKVIDAGQTYGVFQDLYFEAARGYARSKGAKAADTDGASAQMLVNGRLYFVVFVKAAGGGTAVSITDAAQLHREVDEFASRARS